MIDFSTLQGLTIPEGAVTQITDASGRVLWSATIKFTINGDTYIADRGMTWAEWFASDYNTTGETEGDIKDANGNEVSIDAVIVGGTAYEVGFVKTFADFSWEEIILACQSRSVPDNWTIGDQKVMSINGTDYLIDIIGKNHDTYSDGSGVAPLTFQLHDLYTTTYPMNSSSTNNGGWASCAIRNTHLPAIKGMMPSNVQNALRKVNKLTSAGNKSTTINTTQDDLFLLSVIEIYGKKSYSAEGEGSVYAYYSTATERIKYLSGSKTMWWTRSPYPSSATQFAALNTAGTPRAFDASTSYGVAFGFCF